MPDPELRALTALTPTPPVSLDDAVRELYRVVALLGEFSQFTGAFGGVDQPEIHTDAVSGWPVGDYYGELRIFSDGGSPAVHIFYWWSSGTTGDDWLQAGKRV